MERRFKNWGIITIIAVYILILVGGIVRSTGSGMGCPDWPKCFGSWVPPTEVSELPDNYREVYAQKRKIKNERLGKYLANLGFKDLAYRITNDPAIYKEEPFNATKTWIEYLNRLLGALIGVFIFLTLIFSFAYWNKDRGVTWLSIATFILVGIQGWIGSIVVSTNLLPGMITLHMMLAIAIVFLLIWAEIKAQKSKLIANSKSGKLTWIVGIALGISLVQIVFGTQVRQLIDVVAGQLGETRRGDWVIQTGIKFYLHRSFSWIVLVINGSILYFVRKQKITNKSISNSANILIILTLIEMVSGACMAWFGIPPFLQPLHLTLATISAGILFAMLIQLNPKFFGLMIKERPLVQV
jgi:cytochrome c oxidase assembly protein subunit 15